MREFLRRRPWSVHVFAALFASLGVWNLIEGLLDLDLWVRRLGQLGWFGEANKDLAIVWLSARFTIVGIPVVAIWVFASRVARLFIGLTIAYLFLNFVWNGLDVLRIGAFYGWLRYNFDAHLATILQTIAVVLLFTTESNAWFRSRRETQGKAADLDAFE
jgi:hypothetical protein